MRLAKKMYNEIKVKYPDALVWVREDNTYYTFDDDAKKMAEVLKEEFLDIKSVTVYGFTAGRLDNNLSKCVKAGYKVAVCDVLLAEQKNKTYLCQEGEEFFTIQAPNIKQARVDAQVWNAVVIKQVRNGKAKSRRSA